MLDQHLTDLEQLIKTYRTQVDELSYTVSQMGNEPEGQYAKISFEIAVQKLRLFRMMKDNYSGFSSIQNLITKLESGLERESRFLVHKLCDSKNTHHPSFLISSFIKRKDSIKAKISQLKQEIQKLDEDGTEFLKPDFIYEQVESLFDDSLEKFELRFSYRHRTINHNLKISKIGSLVSVILVKTDGDIRLFHDLYERATILKNIGYHIENNIWSLQLDMDKSSFDDLITIVARTLFEVLEALNMEIEVIF